LNIVLTFVICGLYPTLSGFICGLSYPKGVHYLSNIFNFVQIIVGSYQLGIRARLTFKAWLPTRIALRNWN